MRADRSGIEAIIPHRPPFLLIDEITHCLPGVEAHGLKMVSGDEWFLRGHFPDYPIMPGVLILEAMAQVGAFALLSLAENRGKTALFAGLDKVRFRRQVRPGDLLGLTLKIDRMKSRIGKGTGTAVIGEAPVAEATLTFALEPASSQLDTAGQS